jgi:O-antigen/teichoic acid export membrane protein
MQHTIDKPLMTITKGSGLVFIGMSVGLLLGFISRVLIARYVTQSEYGVYSLAITVAGIFWVLATLGLNEGVTRNIAYSRGKSDIERVNSLVSASLGFGILASVALALILFFTSGAIADGIFHESVLALSLKILSVVIVFTVLEDIIVSVFRGFEQIKPMVYCQNIMRPIIFPLLLLVIIWLGLSFDKVFYAYLIPFVVSSVVLIIYAIKHLPSPTALIPKVGFNPVAGELLLFSLPLLGVVMLGVIIAWTDTIMLGYLKTSVDVGLYNVAHTLIKFIVAPASALLLIYMPVASRMFAEQLMPEMKRNFSVLTKWLCSVTLPLFLVLSLFPEAVISSLFGVDYALAANALRILCLGAIINNATGPSQVTLVAMGKVRFVMWATLAAALLNIGLNIALIPPLGIEGAAIASVVAVTFANLIQLGKLYSLSRAQPLSKNLLKPVLISLAVIFLIYFIFGHQLTVMWWMLLLFLILFYAIYGFITLFTRSLDREDIALLLAIEKKLGMNLSFIKSILRRFL